MADNDKRSATAAPRWIKVLLAGSLALNFAVIAGAVGLVLSDDGPPPPRPDGGFVGISGYVRALDEDHRKEFGTKVRDAFPQPPSKERFMSQAQDMLALIRAEPFDPAALQAQLSAMAERFEVGRKAGDSELIRIINEMTPEERTAYADRLEKRMQKGFEKAKDRPFKPH